MCPCAARAAKPAIPGSTPSRRTRTSATAALDGVRSDRCRHRDRMVGSTSSTDGAQSSHTVRGVGSSIALSRTLLVRSASRSASSTTRTCHRPPDGWVAARPTRLRTSLIRKLTPSVRTTSTSAWVPASAVWQDAHSPHPPRGHCSAAANARAAVERPDPGGPVNSQAWVMPAGSATARTSASTARSWPTRSAQTPSPTPGRGPAGAVAVAGVGDRRRLRVTGSPVVAAVGHPRQLDRPVVVVGEPNSSSVRLSSRVGSSARRRPVSWSSGSPCPPCPWRWPAACREVRVCSRSARCASRRARGPRPRRPGGRPARPPRGRARPARRRGARPPRGPAPRPRRRPAAGAPRAGPPPRGGAPRPRRPRAGPAPARRPAGGPPRRRRSSAVDPGLLLGGPPGGLALLALRGAERQHRLQPGPDRGGHLVGRAGSRPRRGSAARRGAPGRGSARAPARGRPAARPRAGPGRSPGAAPRRPGGRARRSGRGPAPRWPSGTAAPPRSAPGRGRRPGRRPRSRRSGRSPPRAPSASAGAMTVATCSARSAANSSASARGDSAGAGRPSSPVGSSSTDRSRRPTSVAPGSWVTTTSWPSAVSQASRARAWVDLPAPSPPSSATRKPCSRRASARGPDRLAVEGRRDVGRDRHPAAVVEVAERHDAERGREQPGQQEGDRGAVVGEHHRVGDPDLVLAERGGEQRGDRQHQDQHDPDRGLHEGEGAAAQLVGDLETEQRVAGHPGDAREGAEHQRQRSRR